MTPRRSQSRFILPWFSRVPGLGLAASLILVNIVGILLLPLIVPGLPYTALLLPIALIVGVSTILLARFRRRAFSARHDNIEPNTSTLQFLAELSKLLALSLDFETTLKSLSQLLVPRLADWCLIDMLEPDGNFYRLAAIHADPSKAALIRELQEQYGVLPAHAKHTILKVFRANQSWLDPDVSPERFVAEARDAEHLRILRGLGFKSEIVVALAAREQLLGTITLVSASRSFNQNDLALAEECARRAAVAIDNARLYREAQNALQVRDQFLSIAAHELKTPLTSLRGFSQILQRRMLQEHILSERDARAVEMIDVQAQRLSKLVDTLLDVARLQLGQFTLDIKPLDLCVLVQCLIDEIKPTLDKHTIELQKEESPLMINGDVLRLEQVFQNLLQNAVKYSPTGGAITVRIAKQDKLASVAVADQGIGIPEAAQHNLFQRFYRASNFNPNHISGMGIGLFVVKEIVSLHNGTITVSSWEGKGSVFTVYLPIAE